MYTYRFVSKLCLLEVATVRFQVASLRSLRPKIHSKPSFVESPFFPQKSGTQLLVFFCLLGGVNFGVDIVKEALWKSCSCNINPCFHYILFLPNKILFHHHPWTAKLQTNLVFTRIGLIKLKLATEMVTKKNCGKWHCLVYLQCVIWERICNSVSNKKCACTCLFQSMQLWGWKN